MHIQLEPQSTIPFNVSSGSISLSRSHRRSISTPCILVHSNLGGAESIQHPYPSDPITATLTPSSPTQPTSATGAKMSAKELIIRAVGFGHGKQPQTEKPQTSTQSKPSLASYAANEILSLIFRNLMNRKSILNCSLVSTHWHGPARVELARITQDLPFNGQGLVHAIRTRFAEDTFPFLSMAVFDKLVCNLSELYYHSNPETKEVFAPGNAPDSIYHLFWTFLFIDQEFRNPRARSKVTSPHLIRALHGVEGLSSNEDDNASSRNNRGDTNRPTMHQRQSSFMNLANSMKLEEPFKRVKRWWKNARENAKEEVERNQTSNSLDSSSAPSSLSSDDNNNHPQQDTSTELIDPVTVIITTNATTNSTTTSAADCLGNQPQLEASAPSTLLQVPNTNTPSVTPPIQPVTSPGRSLRSRFGAKSDLALNKSSLDDSCSSILTHGFTTLSNGWRPEGDGLDNIVCFPKSKRPSTLGAQHQILQCSDLMLEMEKDDDDDNNNNDEDLES
ncbi:hypothetical protein BGZ76_006907 [Entomortierella beljakovae]|nr:hypothetical protein BGZ76_006907 [Entomortierella beljakovae]